MNTPGYKKQGKVIGIDLDGVCFNFIKGFSDWLTKRLGVKISEKDIKSYYWYESLDVTKDQFFSEFHRFGRNGGYRYLELLDGTKGALSLLSANAAELFYITNRPNYAYRDTIEALEEHNFPFRKNLIFANGKKSPVIRDKVIDIFIDDSPSTLADICVNTSADVYCRDYPYNRHLDEAFLTRVSSWKEFLEHVLGRKVGV